MAQFCDNGHDICVADEDEKELYCARCPARWRSIDVSGFVTHELTFKRGNYQAGQWRGRCSCGWSMIADAAQDQWAIEMIERAHSEHATNTLQNPAE